MTNFCSQSTYFLADTHFHTFIHHHNLMQPGGADATLHRFRIGIAVGLGDGFPMKFLHTGFGILILGIFQFYDVAVLHVGVDFQHRAEENIRIARLRVLLGDGTVETVLSRHGKGETMDKGFALLLVALRGIAVKTVGNTGEVEIEDEVSVAAQRGMLPDIKVAKKSIKLGAGTQVIVVLKNVQCQALAEAVGTDEEEAVQKRFIRQF